MNNPFSVLISVYKNDNPADFRAAIESVTVKQTIKPDEVYIYVDGPVSTELLDTINLLQKEMPFINVHKENQNKGLGKALQYGMLHVKHELVARMDADDISVPDRFECQLKQFEDDSELAVASGHTADFIGSLNNIIGIRKVPIGNEGCRNYMKQRDAINHPAVMFRKSEVLKAGNYQEWYLNEDSYLWLRMYLAGCKFDNLDKILVYMRSGDGQYARRGGWKYFKSEVGLQRLRLKNGIVSFPRYLFNCSIHFIVKCLLPNSVRGWIFKHLLRKH